MKYFLIGVLFLVSNANLFAQGEFEEKVSNHKWEIGLFHQESAIATTNYYNFKKTSYVYNANNSWSMTRGNGLTVDYRFNKLKIGLKYGRTFLVNSYNFTKDNPSLTVEDSRRSNAPIFFKWNVNQFGFYMNFQVKKTAKWEFLTLFAANAYGSTFESKKVKEQFEQKTKDIYIQDGKQGLIVYQITGEHQNEYAYTLESGFMLKRLFENGISPYVTLSFLYGLTPAMTSGMDYILTYEGSRTKSLGHISATSSNRGFNLEIGAKYPLKFKRKKII